MNTNHVPHAHAKRRDEDKPQACPFFINDPSKYIVQYSSSIAAEGDEDISPLHTMQGPITRARARQLDLQVRSNLVNYFLELMLGSMHVLLIRNNGEDRQGLGEGQGVKAEELGRSHQGVHAQLDFDSTSDSKTLLHQN
jgi:hypothetical protein